MRNWLIRLGMLGEVDDIAAFRAWLLMAVL